MFSHVMVGANDYEASRRFYEAVFAVLGYGAGEADEKGRIFWRSPRGNFAITRPLDGAPATFANGSTIGFDVGNPEKVDAWHAAGLAAGGVACEDPPGWRQRPYGRLYLAYLRDPAGNKLCALHRAVQG